MDQENPKPAPELPPGTDEWGTDLDKLGVEREKSERAASRTPGVVLEALEPGELKIAGRELHDFTLQTYLNLTRLHSPFVEKEGDKAPTIEDILAALWVLVLPDAHVRAMIKCGADAVEEEIAKLAAEIPVAELESIPERIARHLAGAFATTAKLNPPATEGGGTPLAPVSSATAPVGS